MIQLHNRLGSMALMDLQSYNSWVVLASGKCQKFYSIPKVDEINIFFNFRLKQSSVILLEFINQLQELIW